MFQAPQLISFCSSPIARSLESRSSRSLSLSLLSCFPSAASSPLLPSEEGTHVHGAAAPARPRCVALADAVASSGRRRRGSRSSSSGHQQRRRRRRHRHRSRSRHGAATPRSAQETHLWRFRRTDAARRSGRRRADGGCVDVFFICLSIASSFLFLMPLKKKTASEEAS